jgi:streptogramin lyase
VTSALVGSIRRADGKALEGVPVSARASDKTITTTVFTDEQGEYFFPTLESGPYRVWAQAVGYETARANLTLDTTRQTRQAFTLNRLKDFTLQLSGSEWMAALPEDTKEQRRMKEIFQNNCAMCHSVGAVLQHRFDEQGWLAMIEVMGRFAQSNRARTILHHKEELAKYLATVRGPGPSPLQFKLHPRPTGDAARVVITQYDIPVVDQPDGLAWFNGSDWSEGRASHRGYLTHDVIVDFNGNAWLTAFLPARDEGRTERSLAKVNTQTGQVTWFMISGPMPQGEREKAQYLAKGAQADGLDRSTHGITIDRKGIIWFTDFNVGTVGRLDPTTEAFEFFAPPPGMGNGIRQDIDVDGLGKIWGSTPNGAIRFDPETKEWTWFQSAVPGMSYGVAGDAEGNGWWNRFTLDRVGKGDPKTGKVYEVVLRPPWMQDREDVTTPADREFYKSIGALSWGGVNTVPGAQAPRRMGADKHGDTMWVASFLGRNLAKINVRSLETTYYPVPWNGNPYRAAVDKNHSVWVSLLGDDRVLKFEPKTERWTAYQLPMIGCDSRYVAVDDLRGDVWVPCARTSQAVRLQFRSARQLQALKNTSRSANGRGDRR